jgi:5-methylcytosine-specific restriction endonuclease McrA
MTTSLTCRVCGETNEGAAFVKGVSGRPRCKRCHAAAAARARAEKPEQAKAARSRYVSRHPDKVRAADARRRDRPVARLAARQRAATWRAGNVERHRENARRWAQAHPDEVRARSRAYFAAHRVDYAAKLRQWKRANRSALREQQARRRARMLANGYERVDYAAIRARDGDMCHICRAPVSPGDMHFDHVVPLARGGPHTAANIRVSHAACNLRKGARLIAEGGDVLLTRELRGSGP